MGRSGHFPKEPAFGLVGPEYCLGICFLSPPLGVGWGHSGASLRLVSVGRLEDLTVVAQEGLAIYVSVFPSSAPELENSGLPSGFLSSLEGQQSPRIARLSATEEASASVRTWGPP